MNKKTNFSLAQRQEALLRLRLCYLAQKVNAAFHASESSAFRRWFQVEGASNQKAHEL